MKQTSTEISTIEISNDNKDSILRISKYKARRLEQHQQKQKVSRELKIAYKQTRVAVVCPDTGITSYLEIPAIPNQVMIMSHPLALIENSRGIAQQSYSYLINLDHSILAGILIVLANDYQLFSYQPSDSGLQKNAILRTVRPATLINAIRIIEDMIHSSNHYYIPKLSLKLTKDIEAGGFETIIQNWLKLVVDSIYKPDDNFYDENQSFKDKIKAQRRAKQAFESAEQLVSRKEEKQLNDDCQVAKAIIIALALEEKISSRLKIALLGIFQKYQILTMESAARNLLTSKLQDVGGYQADQLVSILNKSRTNLVAKTIPADDFFDDFITSGEKLKEKELAKQNKPINQSLSSVIILNVALPSLQPTDISNNDQSNQFKLKAQESFTDRIKRLKAEKNNQSI